MNQPEYQAEITFSGSPVIDIGSKGFEFKMDLDGEGIHPPDLLLAGLGSCVAVYARKYFRNVAEKPAGFKIKVWGDLDGEKGSYRFKKINVELDLMGFAIDEMHRNALQRFVENCPVDNTLKYPPEVELKLK